ncbi:hypothetical protein D3C83_219910 [compost metagenome]
MGFTFRSKNHSVVTRALGSAIAMRALIGSEPNAENSGLKTAPRFQVPRALT